MTTYFAVCNVNGPISVEINAETDEAAAEQFEAMDHQAMIDDPRMDAEDALDVCGDGMSESEFDEILEQHCDPVMSLNSVVVGQGPTTRMAHIGGGWFLWRQK